MRTILLWSLLAVVTGPALGHARLTHSDPAQDDALSAGQREVILQFSEAIQPRFSDFVFHYLGQDAQASADIDNRLSRPVPIYDQARQQVTLTLPMPARPGWYVLDWEVLAADGHTTGGTLRFVLAP